MKLPFIASLIALVSVVGCAAAPPPAPLPPVVVTIRDIPTPPVRGEVVEDSVVVVESVQEETHEAMNPEDYQRLSGLIHRETASIKCVCTAGDPHCFCRLPNGPKILPKE